MAVRTIRSFGHTYGALAQLTSQQKVVRGDIVYEVEEYNDKPLSLYILCYLYRAYSFN